MTFNCGVCKNDPVFKNAMGCVTPSQIAVWEDYNGNQFFNCPWQFISEEAFTWFERYKYEGNSVKFNQQAAKYLEAINYFNSEVSNFIASKNPREDRTGKSLAALRSSFQRRQNA
jgi:hypothetical protein